MRNKIIFNRKIFNEIDTASKAYWLGFITCDGCIYRYELRLKLGYKDKNHLYKYLKFVEADPVNGPTIKTQVHQITGNDTYLVRLCDKPMVQLLQDKYKINYHKSLNEIFYNGIPDEFKRDYIRGIIEADGGFRQDFSAIHLCGSLNILTNVKETFTTRLNCNSNIHIRNVDGLSRIQWNGKRDKINIFHYLYDNCNPDIYLDRKYELGKKMIDKFEKEL